MPPVSSDGIEAGFVHQPGGVDGVVNGEAAFKEIIRVQLGQNGIGRACFLADGIDDLAGEAGAVLNTAAVLVGTGVDGGRDEFAEEIAVCGVYLHAVKAHLLALLGRVREILLDLLDFAGGKHVAALDVLGNDRADAVAGEILLVAEEAGVGYVQTGQGPVAVDSLHKINESLAAGVIDNGNLAEIRLSAGFGVDGAGENKGCAAGRQLSVKIDHSVGDMALAVGHALVRGRTDSAVAQDKILNLRFFEQCSHN